MENKISVVICAKNAEKTIVITLESIIKNKPFEIIVVDGDSKDNTVNVARKYTDRIYSDQNKGLAYARQLGAEKAQGDYIAYIDSDTELPNKNVLSTLHKELCENNWVAIHTQLVDPRDKKSYWEQGEDFHWRVRFNKVGERRYLGAIVCLIHRDMILKYKFDPFFKGAGEDGDFYHRLGEGGYKFGVSSAIAYHYHRSSFKDFVKQRIWYGKGNARVIVKHNAIKHLFAPFGIAFYGIWLCVNQMKIKFIPFYFIWMGGLFIGIFIGIIELIFQRKLS